MSTTTTLSVPAIHCDTCKSSIEGALTGLEGVSSADVDVEAKTVTVSFDDGSVGMDLIKETIEDQGFDVA